MLTNNRGFTLIEILAVMGIIAILLSIGMSYYRDSRSRTCDAVAISDAKNLVTAATESFALDGTTPGFNHDPGDGRAVGKKPQGHVFHLSGGVKAKIIGSNLGDKQGYMEAYVYHTGGSFNPTSPLSDKKRFFYCMVDEGNNITVSPQY